MILSSYSEVWEECGGNAAILFTFIVYWVQHSQRNKKHFIDGRYWTYNTRAAFHEQFSFLSEDQIRTALKKLEENNFIFTGSFNKMKGDQTKWYTLTDKGIEVAEKYQNHVGKIPNVSGKNPQPIPNNYTDNIPPILPNGNIPPQGEQSPKTKRFVPPTVDEVRTYCAERGNGVDAEQFVDFYESKGWLVGKTKMKDWKAAVRTWEKGERKAAKKSISDYNMDWWDET